MVWWVRMVVLMTRVIVSTTGNAIGAEGSELTAAVRKEMDDLRCMLYSKSLHRPEPAQKATSLIIQFMAERESSVCRQS